MTTPRSTTSCPGCGKPLPADAPRGLCPQCLLSMAMTPGLKPREPEDASPAAVATGQPGPRRFGDYELLNEIAQGGMGVVYRARQISLGRIVAIKMLLYGRFTNPRIVERFRAEARAAAALRHPHIVAIHEVGEHEGQPYFAMDFVPGRNLAEVIRDQPLPARKAAEYLKTIAEAVHYAHQSGVLHRDLKPSNILIDPQDRPWVTDFGLAKRFDGTGALAVEAGSDAQAGSPKLPAQKSFDSLTLSGQMLGSPNYMPPEQVEGTRHPPSPAGDVYSLGAILFQMLTGRPPFLSDSLQGTLLQVTQNDPPSLRLLQPSTPRDLETICLKCLEKDPARRYPSAQALADELECFLHGEPIKARPLGGSERLARWCRRKPALAASLAALTLALCGGMAGILWQWHRAEGEAARARAEALASQRNEYTADMLLAQQSLNENDHRRTMTFLEKYVPTNSARSKSGSHPARDIRGWEWGHLWNECRDDSHFVLGQHSNSVRTLGLLRDGRTLFSGGWDHSVKLWDLPSRKLLAELPHPLPVWGAVASPDGRWLVICALDSAQGHGHGLHLWDLPNRRELPRLCPKSWPRPGQSLMISPDSKWLAVIDYDSTQIVELPSGEVVAGLPSATYRMGPQGVAFTPDGLTLIHAVNVQGDIALVDTKGWTEIARLYGHTRNVNALIVSPDGRLLASLSRDRSIRLWDLATRQTVAVRDGLSEDGWSLAFSPDGKTVALGLDSTVHVLRVPDLAPVTQCRWMFGGAHSLQYLSPGEIAVGGGDGSIKIFNLDTDRQPRRAVRYTAALGDIIYNSAEVGPFAVFSPDKAHYLTVFTNKTFSIWNTATLEERGPLPLPIERFSCAGIASGGDLIAFADQGGRRFLWHVSTKELSEFGRSDSPGHVSIKFSDDGAWVAFTDYRRVQIFEVATGTRTHLIPYPYPTFVRGFRFTPDRKHVFGDTSQGDQWIWSLDHPEQVMQLQGLTADPYCLALTPDGNTLIAPHGETRLWDLHTGALKQVLSPAYGEARSAAVSPDGKRLALGMQNGNISILDLETFREVAAFRAFDERVGRIAFTPDGSTLFAATVEGMRIWKAVTLKGDFTAKEVK